MKFFTHAVAVMLLISTSFLISATLSTISATLGLIYYDVVDVGR